MDKPFNVANFRRCRCKGWEAGADTDEKKEEYDEEQLIDV